MEIREAYEEKAIRLVRDLLGYEVNWESEGDWEPIKLVWFCKTLQNWKALIVDLSEGGFLYEVTYNGDKKESYVDVYVKEENVVVKD